MLALWLLSMDIRIRKHCCGVQEGELRTSVGIHVRKHNNAAIPQRFISLRGGWPVGRLHHILAVQRCRHLAASHHPLCHPTRFKLEFQSPVAKRAHSGIMSVIKSNRYSEAEHIPEQATTGDQQCHFTLTVLQRCTGKADQTFTGLFHCY